MMAAGTTSCDGLRVADGRDAAATDIDDASSSDSDPSPRPDGPATPDGSATHSPEILASGFSDPLEIAVAGDDV